MSSANGTAPLPLPQGAWNCLGEPSGELAYDALPASLEEFREAAVQRARADLEPAGPDVIDDAIIVMSGFPSQGQSEISAASQAALYHMALDEIPADLLALAIRRASKKHTFRPMPAQLLALVDEEFAARRRRLARLERS